MTRLLRFTLCSLAIAVAVPLASAAQSEGLPPEWEIRKNLQELAAQMKRFQPLLDSFDTNIWKQHGAPDAYAAQLTAAKSQITYLADAAERLARQPEQLAVALETSFRLQALETGVGSLTDAVRKYQNGAIAELVQAQMTESAPQRDKLRSYVVALAAAKEQQLAVANEEAQRCRAVLSRQPPAVKKQERK